MDLTTRVNEPNGREPVRVANESPLRRWYERKVTELSFLGQVLRKFRRFYLGTFNPEYIEAAIAETREGECHRCGLCCQLVYKCPFLGRDSQNLPYCRIYGDLRPTNCHSYPFDRTDHEIKGCGYTFKPASVAPGPGRPMPTTLPITDTGAGNRK